MKSKNTEGQPDTLDWGGCLQCIGTCFQGSFNKKKLCNFIAILEAACPKGEGNHEEMQEVGALSSIDHPFYLALVD